MRAIVLHAEYVLSGYIPQSRRKPEAAGAFATVTIKIPNEPVPKGRKLRKKIKRDKGPTDLPKRELTEHEKQLHEAALAKAALETKKAITIPVGPVDKEKSFAQIQREFNAISYPVHHSLSGQSVIECCGCVQAFYQHPVMYPAPHFRNPPTHRSCARHRDMVSTKPEQLLVTKCM